MAEPMEREGERHAAGTTVLQAGVYRVYHYAHRIPHLVMILRGGLFPSCQYCGEKVSFMSMVSADLIGDDYDFCARN